MVEFTDWPVEAMALWRRLSAHSFANPEDGLDLTRRLAREQGWTIERARGAIDEYRRFCFLCGIADGPLTPSQEVDEVWHLHLIHTRDYWQQFCAQVLGIALHHGPTRGGQAERRRYREQYARTLATYERWFGPPPLDFWPASRERFANPGRIRRVDLDRHLILPRPRLPNRRWLVVVGGLLAGALATEAAAAFPSIALTGTLLLLGAAVWLHSIAIAVITLITVVAVIAVVLWRSFAEGETDSEQADDSDGNGDGDGGCGGCGGCGCG